MKITATALLSTYNNEKYINQTIESVLSQSFRDFEFIIVNDGSTDRTKDILDSYSDKRLKVIHLPQNIGIPNALNLGLEYCSGEYIIKIDGDDIQDPARFEKQVEFMDNNPDIVLSKCLYEYFSDDPSVLSSDRFQYYVNHNQNIKNNLKTSDTISEAIRWHCCIAHTTMIIKTELLKIYKYNNYPLFEDYDLFYRLNNDGFLMGHLDELLVKVRISSESTTAVSENTLFNEIAFEIKKNILNTFKGNHTIYIWGTGSYAKDLTNLLNRNGWIITGYIDSYKGDLNNLFMGKKIVSPKVIDNTKAVKVVIAASTGFYEIIDYLKHYDYETDIDFVVLR